MRKPADARGKFPVAKPAMTSADNFGMRGHKQWLCQNILNQ
jgi:hypothetical protein